MEDVIIAIDPRFFKGGDATDHICQGCGLRPACHTHHKEFKKIGGRGKKKKAYIERPENKIELGLAARP